MHDGVWKLAIDPFAQFTGQRLNGARRQRPGFIYSDFNTHNCPEAIYCLFIQLTDCGGKRAKKNISLSATSSGFHRPEGDHGFIAQGDLFWLGGRHALQLDEVFVERQAIETRAVERAEGLKVRQRAELFEHRGVSRDGIRRVETAGAAAAGLFAMLEVRRGSVPRKKRSEPLATA